MHSFHIWATFFLKKDFFNILFPALRDFVFVCVLIYLFIDVPAVMFFAAARCPRRTIPLPVRNSNETSHEIAGEICENPPPLQRDVWEAETRRESLFMCRQLLGLSLPFYFNLVAVFGILWLPKCPLRVQI